MFNADALKKLREKKKFSPEKLVLDMAHAINFRVSRQTIYNWEAGDSVPDANELQKLAKYFKKPVEVFFDQNVKFGA